MNGKVSYFRLGLFVLVGLVLFIGALLAFGARAWFEKGVKAETYLDESVQGLDVGSPVKYRGVQIGKVTYIGFAGQKYALKTPQERLKYGRYVLVEMEVSASAIPATETHTQREAMAERVKAGLRVRLTMSSIAGPSYLEVDYLDSAANPPLEIIWKPEHLYIPSTPSTGVQVRTAVDRIADQLERVHIDELFANVQSLTQTADRAIQQLQAEQLGQQTVSLLQELRQSNQQLQDLLGKPEIVQSLENISGATEELQSSAHRLAEVLNGEQVDQILNGLARTTENAGPTVAQLRGVAADLHQLLTASRTDIQTIVRSLRRITTNLEAVSDEARRNPPAILFSQPPPHVKPGEK